MTYPNQNPDLLELLGYSQEGYETMKINRYFKWCESFATNIKSYQKVIANRAISDFFNNQWAKCETEFLEEISQYPNFDIKINLQHFGRCLIQLHNKYPKDLLQSTHNIKIINQL